MVEGGMEIHKGKNRIHIPKSQRKRLQVNAPQAEPLGWDPCGRIWLLLTPNIHAIIQWHPTGSSHQPGPLMKGQQGQNPDK